MKTIEDFWIPLKEKKPEDGQAVLVWWPNCPDPGSEDHCYFKARFCRYDKRTPRDTSTPQSLKTVIG